MSRQEVADSVNAYLWDKYRVKKCLDETDIGRLERGENRWPGKLRREAFRAVLHVQNDREIGFYIDRTSTATSQASQEEPVGPMGDMPPPDALSGAIETATVEDGINVSSDRRRVLLTGIAMIAAASGLSAVPSRARRRRLGPSDVARLNALTTLYRSIDYEYGGGILMTDLGRFAEAASALLDMSYSNTLAPALHSSIAAARQLAGWTAFDAGHHSDAQRHLLSAEREAVAGRDLLLAARIRYCQARQLQHLRHNRDALDTLRLARDHLGTATTPAVSAMIYGAEAASRAALGQADLALSALGKSRTEFERIKPGREPDWMSFYDQGELLAQYGRVYRDFARADRQHSPKAVRSVTEAIAAFGPQNVRSTILNEVGLCSALFLDDQPEAAILVGQRVQAQSTQVSSQRVVDRIANLRRDLTRHRELPAVVAFAQSLPKLRSGAA
jgi:hypothetical protein